MFWFIISLIVILGFPYILSKIFNVNFNKEIGIIIGLLILLLILFLFFRVTFDKNFNFNPEYNKTFTIMALILAFIGNATFFYGEFLTYNREEKHTFLDPLGAFTKSSATLLILLIFLYKK